MLIVLPRECTGHSKYPLSSLYTVSKTNTLYAVSIQSAKTRPGADYGSDHELLIAKFRLKLKKTGTYTKRLRCDLNQIAYDYTVEVTNRFKGLDLLDRMPDEL